MECLKWQQMATVSGLPFLVIVLLLSGCSASMEGAETAATRRFKPAFALIAGGFAFVKKRAAEEAQHDAQVQRNAAVLHAAREEKQRKEAERQTARANKAKEEADRQTAIAESRQRSLQRRLAAEWKEKGLGAWEGGNPETAFRWFAEALREEESIEGGEGEEDADGEAAPGQLTRQRLRALLAANAHLGRGRLSAGPFPRKERYFTWDCQCRQIIM